MLKINETQIRTRLPLLTVIAFAILTLWIRTFPPLSWSSGITGNALPLHTLLEFLGILVSFAVFTVGWATYQNVRSADILVLSVIAFTVGWFDLFHTLSFTGMPDFVGPSGPNKAIYFWLASRFVGSLGFLYVSLAKPRQVRSGGLRFWLMTMATLLVAAWSYVVLLHANDLPVMFVQGVGLTPLKLILEWTTIGLSFVAGLQFFARGSRGGLISMQWMGGACLLFAMSGYFFTGYVDFNDLYNFVGHVFKAVASFMVYRAVFLECVSQPYADARRLAKDASEASVSKSRFLANVSHELRTPLGIITGFSDLLMQKDSLDTEARDWATTIGRNSRQLRELIDDLLDLSKAEDEKMTVEFSEFTANAVIAEVIAGLQLQADKKNISLLFKSELHAGRTLKTDEVRFRQILLNVTGNAVKFTSRGSVTIVAKERKTTEPEATFIEICVIDTGIGVNPSDAEKLFQPFAQANDPAMRRFGGTGLGLALSKNLSSLLGGDLELRSSRKGEGSEFVFWVLDQPIELARKADGKPASVQTPDFSQLQILAAEDSSDNRNLLALYLKPTNAKLTFAVNGAEAVEFASPKSRREFDVILMDIQMPEMDGFEAVSRLRASGVRTPILALTAHAHQPERERAMQSGFDGYLVKPLSRSELWQSLTKIFSHSRPTPKV